MYLAVIYDKIKLLLQIVQLCLSSARRIEDVLKEAALTGRAIREEQTEQRAMLVGIQNILAAVQIEQANQALVLEAILTEVKPLPAVGFVFDAEFEDGVIQEGVTMISITNTQKVHIPIKPVNRLGKPAPIDGAPVAASSDETVVRLEMDADNGGVTAIAVGPDGTAKVSVSADADLGTGVQTIFGTLDITVKGGAAVGFDLTPDAPVEQ